MKNLKFLPVIAAFGAVASVVCWSPLMGQTIAPAKDELRGIFIDVAPSITRPRAGRIFGLARHKHEKEVRSLILQYQKSDNSSEKADIRDKLVATVNQQFDDRQAAREEELKQLEEQVRRLRELQQRRKSAKQDIVQNRVDQLFREAEGLGWATPTQSAGPPPWIRQSR